MQRYRNLSRNSRILFWAIIAAMVAFVLYAIFSTSLGQTALLVCCGGIILIVVIGLISERGMRRT
ncbi:MAG: hypothetical protein UZ15_CFX003002077 [Chloroflexi bacterium OLB15]|nr:MAG: hypothetical protein UZ15_CFX003002077 [Chloroflexi bacterium OLB15]